MPTTLYSKIIDRHSGSQMTMANVKRHHNNNYCHFEEKNLFFYALAIFSKKDKVQGFIGRRQHILHLHYAPYEARVHNINNMGRDIIIKTCVSSWSSVENSSAMLLDKRAWESSKANEWSSLRFSAFSHKQS